MYFSRIKQLATELEFGKGGGEKFLKINIRDVLKHSFPFGGNNFFDFVEKIFSVDKKYRFGHLGVKKPRRAVKRGRGVDNW